MPIRRALCWLSLLLLLTPGVACNTNTRKRDGSRKAAATLSRTRVADRDPGGVSGADSSTPTAAEGGAVSGPAGAGNPVGVNAGPEGEGSKHAGAAAKRDSAGTAGTPSRPAGDVFPP